MIWINETAQASASIMLHDRASASATIMLHERALSDANLMASDIAVILRFIRLLCTDNEVFIVTDDNMPIEIEM